MKTNIAFYSATPQCGKSTCSSYLVQNHGYSLASLANPFKLMLETLFETYGFDKDRIRRMIYGDLKETIIPEMSFEREVTPRYLMRTIGTDWGVDLVSKNIWCNTIPNEDTGLLVMEDMRQVHEYEYFKNWTKIKLIRPNEFEQVHRSDGQLCNHEFDYVITNTGSLNDLYNALEIVVMDIKNKELQNG